jgi:hypothetical protein
VKALYTGYSKVTIAVALILVVETAVNAWLLMHGQREHLFHYVSIRYVLTAMLFFSRPT